MHRNLRIRLQVMRLAGLGLATAATAVEVGRP